MSNLCPCCMIHISSKVADTHLPVCRCQRHARVDPTLLRGAVGCETDVSCKKVSTARIASTFSYVGSLTYQPESLYLLRSRTSGFGNPNRGRAVADVNNGGLGSRSSGTLVIAAEADKEDYGYHTEVRLWVRSYSGGIVSTSVARRCKQ